MTGVRASLAIALRTVASRLPGGRRLHTELEHARRQRDRLQHTVDGLRERALARQLDPQVLAQVLPLRAAAVASRHDVDASLHEQRLVARSESYGRLVEAPPPADAVRLSVDGVSMWYPSGDAARAPRLPLEEILHSRELAVGRVMIDVGANVGSTSVPRVLLGDFERIYAAEPAAANYACLVRNVVDAGVRGRVLPEQIAIGDRDAELLLQRSSSTTHHLVAGTLSRGKEADAVQSLRLDTWIERLGVDPAEITFVKSDTQGWDGAVLSGAERLGAHRHIAWQIEFSPSMLRRAGWPAARMVALVQSRFTHFIDMRSDAGARSQPVAAMGERLAYLGSDARSYTNLLLYTA